MAATRASASESNTQPVAFSLSESRDCQSLACNAAAALRVTDCVCDLRKRDGVPWPQWPRWLTTRPKNGQNHIIGPGQSEVAMSSWICLCSHTYSVEKAHAYRLSRSACNKPH